MDILAAPDTSTSTSRQPSPPVPSRDAGAWGRRRGLVLAGIAVLVAALLTFHDAVPNSLGHLGSLVDTVLPWLGFTIPPLLGLALLRRAGIALLVLPLPAIAWLNLFGGVLASGQDGAYDLVAVQHNVSDANTDPAATARALTAVAPDIIALEEVTPPALPAFAAVLDPDYPHHAVLGTVGLWSRFPLTDVELLEIRPRAIVAEWSRGLRATVRTPRADVRVYVAHLPSLRFGPTRGFGSTNRDDSAARLGAAIAAEPAERLILLGDLNGTLDDRGLGPVTSQLTSDRSDFAFSWPVGLPFARIDHVMARSATVTDVWTLPPTSSDHLPVAARIRF